MISWLKSLFRAKGTQSIASDSKDFHEGMQAMLKGNEYLLVNDFNSALPYYDQAIRSNIPDGYNQRAVCLQALNYHAEALPDFDKAVEASPQDCNIYFMRAMSRIKLRDNAGAISDMRAAIALSKVDNELNRVYNEGRIKDGGLPLHDYYTLQLQGIEVMARLNELRGRIKSS